MATFACPGCGAPLKLEVIEVRALDDETVGDEAHERRAKEWEEVVADASIREARAHE
jgi:hypothetical protein